MSVSELLVPNPQPANVELPVRCVNCEHFVRNPYYKVGGQPTVCSHDRIGRGPNEIPCPNFSLDTLPLRNMQPATKLLIGQLIGLLQHELGTTRKGIDGLLHLSTVLRNLYHMNRAGLHFNQAYAVEGSTVVGRLVSFSGRRSTLETDAGLPYTVETRLLREIPKPAPVAPPRASINRARRRA